jgi:hypothetical protein
MLLKVALSGARLTAHLNIAAMEFRTGAAARAHEKFLLK